MSMCNTVFFNFAYQCVYSKPSMWSLFLKVFPMYIVIWIILGHEDNFLK